MRRTVPILTYHSIDGSGSILSTDAATLAKQMEHLWRAGYRSATLPEVLDVLTGKTDSVSPLLALTFDDGYASVCDAALSVLERFGYVATVFVATDLLGGKAPWSGRGACVPGPRLMDVRQLEKLRAAGWQIGGHSATHRILTRPPDDALRGELDRCLAFLESLAGRRPLPPARACCPVSVRRPASPP